MTDEHYSGRSKILASDLLDDFHRLADGFDRPPKRSEMDQRGLYSARTYDDRLGSWTAAIHEAGLDVSDGF